MKVVRKQKNSKSCIVCGINNPAGLRAPFYEMEDGSVVTLFEYKAIHQSYPGRAHGGMITCMLDELAGRVIWVGQPVDNPPLAVTSSLKVKFRKPVPFDEQLIGIGRLAKENSRGFVATAEIRNKAGAVLAQAEVTYVKLPASAITSSDMVDELDVFIPDDVTDIEI